MINKLFEFTISQFIGDDIETLRSEKFALVIKVKSKNEWLAVKTEKDIKVEIKRNRGLDFEHIKIDFIEANHISIISKEMKENEEKYLIKEVFIEEMKQAIHRFMILKEVAYQAYEKTFFSVNSAFIFWVVFQNERIKINEYIKKDGGKLNEDERQLLNELNVKSYNEIKKEKLASYIKFFYKKPFFIIMLISLIIGFSFMYLESSGISIIAFVVSFITITVMAVKNIKLAESDIKKTKDIKLILDKEGFNEDAIQNYKNFRKNLYNILKI